MKKYLVIVLLASSTLHVMAQVEKPYYYQIPETPDTYTAGNVAGRMVDGLGFRYFWATDSLRPEDLAFKPSEEARTTEQTIDHILGLTQVVVNATRRVANGSTDYSKMSFSEKRELTLANIKEASITLKASSPEDMETYILKFTSSEFPFWNNINGPIADALWHVGQVVTHRRTSGNPFTSKVSVLQGKKRE